MSHRVAAQLEAIDHVLRGERHVVVTLVTGWGKSMIFRLGAVMEAALLSERQLAEGGSGGASVTFVVIIPYQSLGQVRFVFLSCLVLLSTFFSYPLR